MVLRESSCSNRWDFKMMLLGPSKLLAKIDLRLTLDSLLIKAPFTPEMEKRGLTVRGWLQSDVKVKY